MSQYSRRRFLEDSMFAAAAAVAASGAAPLLAAEEKRRVSPNEKLSIAIVGARGRGAEHLAEYVKRSDVEITYICDADMSVAENRAGDVEKKTGRRPKVVQDLRRVIDDKSVHCISTATPNHWHALVAIWSLQAGKHVYVEKPVSHNVSEGRRIVEAARKYNLICQTGTQCRSMGGTIEAIDYVHSGKIGELQVARGLCYKRRPSIGPKGNYEPPKSVDYNLWSGPAPQKPVTRKQFHYDWHWQWDYGNGDLGNQGIHQMDIARWGLGVDKFPERSFSYGGRLGYEDAGETANTQVLVHDYGNKQLVFEVRGLPTPKLRGAGVGVIFEGTDGYVVLTSYDSGAAFDKDGKEVKTFKAGGDHFGNFLAAVRAGKREMLHADILEGHLSSALCHLGNISYRLGNRMSLDKTKGELKGTEQQETFERFKQHLAENNLKLDETQISVGRHLKIDVEHERFVDDSQADAMLTREYREPFIVPAAGKV